MEPRHSNYDLDGRRCEELRSDDPGCGEIAQVRWRESDFHDINGVLVTGTDAYVTPERLARMLQVTPEEIQERISKKRIPSIRGLVRGQRIIPLSLLEARFEEAKASLKNDRTAAGTAEAVPATQAPTRAPEGDDPLSVLQRRRTQGSV